MAYNQGYTTPSRSIDSITEVESQSDDRIFFVAILRNEEVLVKFSQYIGNFDQVLEQVIPKIVKTNGIKMTLNYEK